MMAPIVSLPTSAPDPELRTVADAGRQFEALLLRRVLSSLERSTSLGGSGSADAKTYGSMLVDAMADAVANAGGLGLADVITSQVARQSAAEEKK